MADNAFFPDALFFGIMHMELNHCMTEKALIHLKKIINVSICKECLHMQPQVDFDEATVGLKASAGCDLNVAFHT